MGPRTALLVGATGLVGGHLLRRLLADDAYGRVIAIVRRPLEVKHPKLHMHVLDFDKLPHDFPAEAVDDVFIALGTTIKKAGTQEAFRKVDHTYVVETARAARGKGAKQALVVSAVDADPASRIFYNRVKGETETALRSLGYPALHLFRPSILLGEREELRPGERAGIIGAKLLRPLLVGKLRKYRGTPADGLAAAMIHVAKRGEGGIHVHEGEAILRHADA
ncbi:MAG TPA: oxidoreductase [Candidatus Thermoplasmatota archaeon]|nr:oxidoreductase [Candidatus Thermoplasmatota archaeon]